MHWNMSYYIIRCKYVRSVTGEKVQTIAKLNPKVTSIRLFSPSFLGHPLKSREGSFISTPVHPCLSTMPKSRVFKRKGSLSTSRLLLCWVLWFWWCFSLPPPPPPPSRTCSRRWSKIRQLSLPREGLVSFENFFVKFSESYKRSYSLWSSASIKC